MSHFTVLVAAMDYEELEAKLLPYYEYGCTEDMDELVQSYLEFKVKHKAEDFEKDARAIVADDWVQDSPELREKYEAYLEAQDYVRLFYDWDGSELHEGNWGYWHNPNAKWDWWVVGGRWAGAIFGDEIATPSYPAGDRRSDKDSVLVGEVDFGALQKRRGGRALTFAFVDTVGNWVERGNMGWWAIVTNEDDSYDAKFWTFIESLSDEQRLWVVDCHI